jgi:hypothetical protein
MIPIFAFPISGRPILFGALSRTVMLSAVEIIHNQMAGISAVQEFGFAQDINAPHKKSQEVKMNIPHRQRLAISIALFLWLIGYNCAC